MLYILIKKICNVFVAIFSSATCSLRSMNQCVVIELLVWLLNCWEVIELTKRKKLRGIVTMTAVTRICSGRTPHISHQGSVVLHINLVN